MSWTAEVFQPRHGEVGVAAASAVVSGWGNLGSILTTYALYTGWPSDSAAPGRAKFRKSNLVMVGILCASILSSVVMQTGLWVAERRRRARGVDEPGKMVDGAARREAQQRGLQGLGSSGFFRVFRKGA